ncbi:hypothetical protein LCGC14_2197560, partial [marine sediment metagenome]
MEDLSNPLTYIPKYFKVINKGDESGQASLVPMQLWRVQKHYIENQTRRNVVLKPRQVGMSTGILADNSHALFTIPYQRQTIITHDSETSEFLFSNVQRFYNNLPPKNRPVSDWKSGTRMRFPILDSYIYIDSAKSDSIGVGHTLNRAHLSEVAKWPEKKGRQLFADITQTVPMTGIITAESTPMGRFGLFPEIYHDAKRGINGFKAFFYPWWWDENYIADEKFMTDEIGEITASILMQSTASYLKEEKALAERMELSPKQLAFRRMKIGELKLLFFQEYPENDIDCWM